MRLLAVAVAAIGAWGCAYPTKFLGSRDGAPLTVQLLADSLPLTAYHAEQRVRPYTRLAGGPVLSSHDAPGFVAEAEFAVFFYLGESRGNFLAMGVEATVLGEETRGSWDLVRGGFVVARAGACGRLRHGDPPMITPQIGVGVGGLEERGLSWFVEVDIFDLRW